MATRKPMAHVSTPWVHASFFAQISEAGRSIAIGILVIISPCRRGQALLFVTWHASWLVNEEKWLNCRPDDVSYADLRFIEKNLFFVHYLGPYFNFVVRLLPQNIALFPPYRLRSRVILTVDQVSCSYAKMTQSASAHRLYRPSGRYVHRGLHDLQT